MLNLTQALADAGLTEDEAITQAIEHIRFALPAKADVVVFRFLMLALADRIARLEQEREETTQQVINLAGLFERTCERIEAFKVEVLDDDMVKPSSQPDCQDSPAESLQSGPVSLTTVPAPPEGYEDVEQWYPEDVQNNWLYWGPAGWNTVPDERNDFTFFAGWRSGFGTAGGLMARPIQTVPYMADLADEETAPIAEDATTKKSETFTEPAAEIAPQDMRADRTAAEMQVEIWGKSITVEPLTYPEPDPADKPSDISADIPASTEADISTDISESTGGGRSCG